MLFCCFTDGTVEDQQARKQQSEIPIVYHFPPYISKVRFPPERKPSRFLRQTRLRSLERHTVWSVSCGAHC